MAPRWCRRRGSLLPWLAVLLAGCGVVPLVLTPYRPSASPTYSGPASPCRPDMEVNRLPPMSADSQAMIADLLTYLTKPNTNTCRKILKFGGQPMRAHNHTIYADGHKYVCLDREFSLHTSDACLVYSFGISTDWSFDWDMEAFGCTVVAFDPTINTTTDYQNGSIVFLQYGIGGEDGAMLEGKWRLQTLDTFVRQLRHADRDIHYLKMDVEDSEWAVFRQQADLGRESPLFRNVHQLGVELHFMDHQPVERHLDFYRRTYWAFLRLQEMGFYLFWYEPNPMQAPEWTAPGLEENITYAMEVVWLKTQCVDDR